MDKSFINFQPRNIKIERHPVRSVYCPAGQSAFCRSRPQLKLGEEINSSRLVDDYACKNQIYQTQIKYIKPPHQMQLCLAAAEHGGIHAHPSDVNTLAGVNVLISS